jgi:hypothetical protein
LSFAPGSVSHLAPVQIPLFLTAKPDKKDKKLTNYVDIKSEGLRDVLRSVLQDVNGICLREEKPSV